MPIVIPENGSTSYEKKLPAATMIHVVDFFCGCGGMSYGFAHTRQSHHAFRILGGLDIDEHALKTYEANIAAPAIRADVTAVAKNPDLLWDLVPGLEDNCRPLLFIGCPPCQGFSAHRKKDERDDPRNSLIMDFARICGHWLPDVVVMENVPEILTGRYKRYFDEGLEELSAHGYNMRVDVLDLSLYGVPQRRRRAVAIGSREAVIPLPIPMFTADAARTVRDAISHLRPLEAGEQDPYDPCHRSPSHTPRILERIRNTPADGGDRRDISLDDQLACHAAIDNGPNRGFTDVYGRLRWDSPSITITAKSSTPSCGRFLHPEQHRNITVREAAILQGFPQSFVFQGPFVHQYRQIGEAVPPLFARSVAWQVLDYLSPRRHPDVIQSPRVMQPQAAEQLGHRHGVAVVDAFCGAGGIALGFQAAGFRSVFAFDVDGDSVSTFQVNVSPVATVADVTDDALPAVIDAAVDGPFVVVGGPPCQGFSQQRRGDPVDSRNNLVLAYADAVRQLKHRPLAVVLENVTYLDSPRGRHILAEYLERLSDMGYTAFRHDLNSAEYAVAQLRHRIVVVALAREVACHYSGPEALTPERWVTVGEALAELPEPAGHFGHASHLPNHVTANETEANRRRIGYVDMLGGRLSIPPDLQLPCHRNYSGHLDVFGRLDWFGQARTVTVGFDSYTRGEFAHPFANRSITHREGAALQGFPHWFAFRGNRNSVRRQIGNAVPPPLAYAVGKGILDAITRSGVLADGRFD